MNDGGRTGRGGKPEKRVTRSKYGFVITEAVRSTELREYRLPIRKGWYCYTGAKRIGLRGGV